MAKTDKQLPVYYLTDGTQISLKTLGKIRKLCPGSTLVDKGGLVIWSPPPGGAVLSGKKQRGKGDQSENQEPLFSAKVPLWLRGSPTDPWIVEDNKDGARFHEPGWRMSWVKFLNSGEECVTSLARNGLVESCVFQGDGNSDKCIQGNIADGLVVKECHFHRFITGIAAGFTKYAKKTHKTTVVGCTFVAVERPILSVRGTVYEARNAFGANGRNGTDNGGRIVAGSGSW